MRKTSLSIVAAAWMLASFAAPVLAAPALTPARLTPGLSKLGLDLVSTLAAGKDAPANVAVSPASLASVLALLDTGADTGMRRALHRTLGLDAPKADAVADFIALRELVGPLMAGKDGSPLTGASLLVFDPVAPPFPKAVTALKAAGAGVSVEKLGDPEALARINAFVAQHTTGLVPKLLEAVPEGAGLVALNALHFKDDWREPFDLAMTKDSAFALPGGMVAMVPMMQSGSSHKLMRVDDKFVAVRLPYAKEGFSLVLLTTKEGAARPEAFRPALAWLAGDGFTEGAALVALPKFSLASSTKLLAGLDKLGLAPARLDPAAFSGLSPTELIISDVGQKIVIEVDEKGTVAAAATDVIMMPTAAAPEPATEIRFDRPFMFALQHEASGLVVMTGYVSDPREK